MIYRLKPQQGDTVAVPQLVFARLGAAEEASVRVALYVLATGVTDPDKLCADLKLRSRISAESALAYWAGAGLLERWDENAAPGGGHPAPPRPRRTVPSARLMAYFFSCRETSFITQHLQAPRNRRAVLQKNKAAYCMAAGKSLPPSIDRLRYSLRGIKAPK